MLRATAVTAASEAVLSASFAPSGTMLVSAGDDGVRLFDATSHAEIGQALPGIAGPPAFAAFTDGHIIVGNLANRAFEWDVNPTDWATHAREVAARNLTREEWDRFLPGRPYQGLPGNLDPCRRYTVSRFHVEILRSARNRRRGRVRGTRDTLPAWVVVS